MKIKTADLTGPALDWAVAKCEGIGVEHVNDGIVKCLLRKPSGRYAPSTDWAQGGPIIERESLELVLLFLCPGTWRAISMGRDWCNGHTPLQAAMRCFVASKLGDVVEVPDELY
jgi:hypothetical protein